VSRTTTELDKILSRIRVQGSLLRSAGLASDEYEDWSAVIASGKMIQEEAEGALDLLDEIVDAFTKTDSPGGRPES